MQTTNEVHAKREYPVLRDTEIFGVIGGCDRPEWNYVLRSTVAQSVLYEVFYKKHGVVIYTAAGRADSWEDARARVAEHFTRSQT